MFDPNSLTMGEVEQFEDYTGLPIDALQEYAPDPDNPDAPAKVPPAKMLTAFAWLIQRRTDPAFTFEQARGMTLAELLPLVSEVMTNPEG